MPSTSVQIWISRASSAAPMIAAEKSEPPRPSVVVTPSLVAPTKPARTATSPMRSTGMTSWTTASGVRSTGSAAPNASVVTTTRRESTHRAGTPSAARSAVKMRLESNSPVASTASAAGLLSSFPAAPDASRVCSRSHSVTIASCRKSLPFGGNKPSMASTWRARRAVTRCPTRSAAPARAASHAETSASVTPAIADTTTTTCAPALLAFATIAAACRIAPTVATEVPPNFIARGLIITPPAVMAAHPAAVKTKNPPPVMQADGLLCALSSGFSSQTRAHHRPADSLDPLAIGRVFLRLEHVWRRTIRVLRSQRQELNAGTLAVSFRLRLREQQCQYARILLVCLGERLHVIELGDLCLLPGTVEYDGLAVLLPGIRGAAASGFQSETVRACILGKQL